MVALNSGNNDESMRQLDELEEHLHSEDEEGKYETIINFGVTIF